MKRMKTASYDDYIFIRLDKKVKDEVKKVSHECGLDMTSWVRQLVIRELKHAD